MLVYIIRRLMQAALVVVVMSVLVFVGVYAIGNPVDILISPDADQLERERDPQRSASTSRCGSSISSSSNDALHGDLGKASFVSA